MLRASSTSSYCSGFKRDVKFRSILSTVGDDDFMEPSSLKSSSEKGSSCEKGSSTSCGMGSSSEKGSVADIRRLSFDDSDDEFEV